MEVSLNTQAQKNRNTANPQCHMSRKRQERDKERLGDDGIHHAASQTRPPTLPAVPAAAFLDILCHTPHLLAVSMARMPPTR